MKMLQGVVDNVASQMAGGVSSQEAVSTAGKGAGENRIRRLLENPVRFGMALCPDVAETKEGAEAVGKQILNTFLQSPTLVPANNFFYTTQADHDEEDDEPLPPQFDFWATHIQSARDNWDSNCYDLI